MRKGQKHTPESKEKNRLSQLASPDHKEHMEKCHAGNVGRMWTSEEIDKRRVTQLASPGHKAHMDKLHAGNVGRTHSPEELEKRRLANLGDKNPMFGKTLSEERVEEIREWATGRTHTLETIEKLRVINTGKKNSPEANEKIRQFRTGKRATKETKLKIGDAERGEKNSSWKGGITPLVRAIRGSYKSDEWRLNVFTRDNFTCVLCNKRGGKLHADHYHKRFSTIFHENNIQSLEDAMNCEDLWDINNGRTLCEEDHRKSHKTKMSLLSLS